MKTMTSAVMAAALFAVPAVAHADAFAQIETGVDAIKYNGRSNEGVHYGLGLGYDVPLTGDVFVGVQGSLTESTIKTCDVVGPYSACIKTGRDMAVLARLGTKVGARGKAYVMGGYANARLRFEFKDPTGSFSDKATEDGYRLAAGYQHDLGHSLYLGAEYRYTKYASYFSRQNGVVMLGARF